MRVFLDHAATTPLSGAARKAMEKWLDAGNASTLYQEGRAAKAAIDEARESVSDLLGVEFAEVIFTSSGTEAASLAIVGAALAGKGGIRSKIILSAAEHHCVLNTAFQLETLGYEVILAPVDRYARVKLPELEELLSAEDILLVAAMHANNELGTLNNPGQIGSLCQKHCTLYFCDAVQTFAKLPFRAADLNADMVSMSAHKIGGPKGAGALYIKAGTPVKPILSGGGQERELRAGTENVAAIAGFGAATQEPQQVDPRFQQRLRSFLESLGAKTTVLTQIPQLPTHLHTRFPGLSAETFLILLDRLGLSAGSGAACSSGSIEPSHVLLACGYSEAEAKEGLRFTIGVETTEEDIAFAEKCIETAVNRLSKA